NIDQDSYMWYLRDYLVLPDVRLARIQQEAGRSGLSGERAAKKKGRKGLKGFFQNLFRKRDKPADSSQVQPTPQEQFDFIDTDTLTQATPPAQQQVEARRGFFAPRRQKPVSGDRNDPALIPAD